MTLAERLKAALDGDDSENAMDAAQAARIKDSSLAGDYWATFCHGADWQAARTSSLVMAMVAALDQATCYFEHGSQGAADCFDEALDRVRKELERMGK